MPKHLKGLEFHELSLVDNPANPHARAPLFKRAAPRDPAAPAGASGVPSDPASGHHKETHMTKEADDLQAQVDKLTEKLEAAEGAAEERDALQAAVKAAGGEVETGDEGPVVRFAPPRPEETVTLADGSTMAKRAVPEPLLKQLDADRARIEKLEAEREAEALAKRAEAELPGLSGTSAVRGAILKAVDGIADEETRKAAHQALAAASNTARLLEKSQGVATAKAATADGPQAEIARKAEEIRKADPNLTEAQAYARAYKNHPELAREIHQPQEG